MAWQFRHGDGESKIMKRAFFCRLAVVGLLALAGPAQAAVVTAYLNTSAPGAGLPTGSLGTVTITDIAGGVTFDVTLINGVNFLNTGGPHTPFVFNMSGGPFSATSITPDAFSNAGPSSATPFGTFSNGINMAGGNGAVNSQHGPLDFIVLGATTSSLTANSLGYFFAADLVFLQTGNTGSVAAGRLITSAVPEPSTWAMLILGFAGVGFMAHRRRHQSAALAPD